MFIGEMMITMNTIRLSEDLIDIAKDFVKIGNEKGFGRDNFEYKNNIIFDFIFYEWKELCSEDVCFALFIKFIIYVYIAGSFFRLWCRKKNRRRRGRKSEKLFVRCFYFLI